MKLTKILTSIVITVLLSTSCGHIKKLNNFFPQSIEAPALRDSIENAYWKYDNFQAKFSVDYESPDGTMNFSGTLRVLHDSLLWISISPGLGLEAVRMLCTPDSVKILNRVDKNYVIGTYGWLQKKFSIQLNFKMLEAIFATRLFVFQQYNGQAFPAGFRVKDAPNFYSLQFPENITTTTQFRQLITLRKSDYRIIKTDVVDGARNFALVYSDFFKDSGFQVPRHIYFSFIEGAKFYRINLTYNRIKFDRKIKMPFKISKRYRRLMIED